MYLWTDVSPLSSSKLLHASVVPVFQRPTRTQNTQPLAASKVGGSLAFASLLFFKRLKIQSSKPAFDMFKPNKPALSRSSSIASRSSISSAGSNSTAASSVSSVASADTQGSFFLKTHRRRVGTTTSGEIVTQQLKDRVRYRGRRDRDGKIKPSTLSMGNVPFPH